MVASLHHSVLWFDIPVTKPIIVHMCNSFKKLHKIEACHWLWKPASVLVEQVQQIGTYDQLPLQVIEE